MLFTSIPFILFLACFLVLYFCTRGFPRLLVCLTGSALFYGWWDWRFLLLLWFVIAVNYGAAIHIGRAESPGRAKALLGCAVAVNLGVLGFFKYLNFFIGSFTDLLHAMGMRASPHALDIILPVGISFYTFQALSYTIDVYRRKIEPEHDFPHLAAYLSFFPQLIAGPIVRAPKFLPQLRLQLSSTPPFDWDSVVEGMGYMLWGFFLKIVIADSLSPFVDFIFENPTHHTSLSLIIASVFFTFQIYCDFHGYSMIAIGIGRILGFDFGLNFDRPYFATSFSGFWKCWHIALSTWIRDYLYISLGGNRRGTLRTHLNLFVSMLLSGLWHGANWTFLAWGALHGFLLSAEKFAAPFLGRAARNLRIPGLVSRTILTLVVFSFVCTAWIFFRAPHVGDAFVFIKRMLAFKNLAFGAVPNSFTVIKGLVLIAFLLTVEWVSLRVSVGDALRRYPILRLASGLVLLYGIALFGTFEGNTFIYFQF